jgi:hypothetical protein
MGVSVERWGAGVNGKPPWNPALRSVGCCFRARGHGLQPVPCDGGGVCRVLQELLPGHWNPSRPGAQTWPVAFVFALWQAIEDQGGGRRGAKMWCEQTYF